MAKNLKNEDLRKQEVFQAVIIDDSINTEFQKNDLGSNNMFQCLLPLANIPILDYTLGFLSSVGVQETILFCMKNSESINEHIKSSAWNSPGSMAVKVVVSEQCQSMGDVMRELDVSNVIQGDFVLMYADTVANAKLLPILQKHKATIQKDKGAVMTMIYTKSSPSHASRCSDAEIVLALDKRNGRILSHQRLPKDSGKISFPLELFLDRPCVELCYDLLDPYISICSAAVPPLFSDNFDYQTRDDLVKGLLLNEDILGNTMYAHCLKDEYVARVSSLATFQAVSMDVIQRWTYPFVPDTSFSRVEKKYTFIHKNNVYKPSSVITGKCEIENSVIGSGTKLGKGCQILNSVIGRNCVIGDSVTLDHAFIWDSCTIEIPLARADKTTEGIGPGCYGSDTDSSDDDFDPNAQNVDEYEVFFSEVLDSLVRGFKERVAMDALIIEINASRFANNIPANEVNHWVMRAILNVPGQTSTAIEKVLVFFKPILERYISKSSNDQHQCLTAIEHEMFGGATALLPSCGKVLHLLYAKDILEEESILRWFAEDAADQIKEQKTVQNFISWLQNAEEESETESD